MERFQGSNNTQGILRTLFIKVETLIFYNAGGLHKMADLLNDPDLDPKYQRVVESKIVAYKEVYAAWTHNYLTGNYQQAIRFGEQARRTSLILQDNNLNIWACFVLGIALTFQGEFEIAKGYEEEAYEKIHKPGVDPVLTMMIPYLAGYTATMEGNFDSALQWLQLATEWGQKQETTAWNFYIKNFYIDALDYLGRFEESEQLLEEMKAGVSTYFKEDNYHLRSYYLITLARHKLRTGKVPQALTFAQQALDLRQKAGGEIYILRCQLTLGTIHRILGNYVDAEPLLLNALQKSVNCFVPYFEASCCLELALLYLGKQNKECLHNFLEKALKISMEKSFYHFYMWRDNDIVQLIKQIENRPPFKGYLEELVRRRSLNLDKSQSYPNLVFPSDETQRPLKLYLLGSCNIAVNDNEIAEFSSHKALYMLKMLATRREGFTVQKLIEEMWLDWGKKSAMNNFYFTLYQLRKILGAKTTVVYKGGLCKLDPGTYWIDVQYFHCLLSEARKLIKQSREKDALDYLSQACALYRGEYLEGEELGTVLSLEREYIERIYYGALLDMAKILTKFHDFASTIEIIEKAKLSNHFDEDAVRLLMIAYYSQGNIKHATDIYKKLKSSLEAEIGASPHNSTTALYSRISRGDDLKDIVNWLLG